jgi:radical SAM superfamily enzyme YgiQ (UPF0313 family)
MDKFLFVHTSKNTEENPDTLLMPIGLVALAKFIKENGYNAEILHLDIEQSIDPNFNLIEYLKKNDFSIVGFDLHWHYQSNRVIKTAKEIKRDNPKIKIILGGFTASFFSEEILGDFREIDFIIRGDSEIPLLKLIEHISYGKNDFKSIPNLVWREGNKIIKNKQTYVVSQEIIDNLKFSNFLIIKNYETYMRLRLNSKKCLTCKKNCNKKYFFYNSGRGCSVNCSYCGGSSISQKIINCRKKPILINHDSVIRELRNSISLGLNIWYTCFDPYPKSSYYPDLFNKLKEQNMRMGLIFESWSLPSKEFIDQFAGCFDLNTSQIIISPDVASESVRKRNKGFFYSNKDLIKTINYAEKNKIPVTLYFAAGLPFEKKIDIIKTLALINFIKNKFRNVKIIAREIEFEPASPSFLNRKKYGVSSYRNTFLDFFNIHETKSDLGYYTKNISSDEVCSTIRLMNAEANCIKKESHFFLRIEELGSIANLIDLNKLHYSCEDCEKFRECFF